VVSTSFRFSVLFSPGSLPVKCCCAKMGCFCHCEEQSDEAIPILQRRGLLRSLRSLAMTQQQQPRGRPPLTLINENLAGFPVSERKKPLVLNARSFRQNSLKRPAGPDH
jgi:hypothetical protein